MPRADREVLRVSQSRAGFAALDAWLERQPELVTLVTMESSGHYWMPIASHLRRKAVPLAVVNPLAAKYFAKSRLARTKSDPADARSLAEMGMRDSPPTRDPLEGAELRQAARFAMTLVTEQSKVCQRLLRLAPTARAAMRRRTATLANANAGPGHRRLGSAKAERLQAAATDSIAVPELEAEVAFEVGLLLDQYDLLENQIAAADRRVAELLDGELARRLQTIPGVGPSTTAILLAEIGDISRFSDFDQGRTPRPPGTCQKPATATFAPPPIGWPSSASSTTRSSPPTTHASGPPASRK
jgi:transposase